MIDYPADDAAARALAAKLAPSEARSQLKLLRTALRHWKPRAPWAQGEQLEACKRYVRALEAVVEPQGCCGHEVGWHELDPERPGYTRCMIGRVAPDGGWEYYCGCRRRVDG